MRVTINVGKTSDFQQNFTYNEYSIHIFLLNKLFSLKLNSLV